LQNFLQDRQQTIGESTQMSRPTLHPYLKLSRHFGRERLAALSTTRALNVLVYFWCVQEADGTVMASYRQIMQGIGTRSHGAVAAALARLETCGLIARLGGDAETGVARYVLLEDWTRYMGKGEPQGSRGAPPSGAPPAPTPESGAPPSPEGGALLENLVVVDPDQDSQQQHLSNSAPEGGAPPAPKSGERHSPQDDLPGPLRVAVEEGFLGDGPITPLAEQAVGELVERYGAEAVLEGMAISVRQNRRTLAYLRGVLRNRAPLRAFQAEAPDDRPKPPPPPAPTEGERRWQAACADLRVQLPHETYDAWLRDARLVECVGDVFTVGVGQQGAVDWLEGRLKGVIVRALRRAAGEGAELRFVVNEGA
jgi:hypothetical protein